MAAALQEQQARTPSPAPQPPIPAAPGPRATALQRLYDDAVSHILKTCSYEKLSACFPTLSTKAPWIMTQVHSQLTEELEKSMKSEFAKIMDERDVVPALNELDGLIEEARRRKNNAGLEGGRTDPVPPHTLPASQLYLAHLSPLLSQPLQEMRTQQASLETENVDLLNRVQQQRKEIETLVGSLEATLGDLEASVQVLQEQQSSSEGGQNVEEGLRNVVRDVQAQLRGGE